MRVHLLDGTYELFRHHFGAPRRTTASGLHVGAVRGVLASVLYMFEDGVTHLGVATDHVIESFRNDLYPGYKTSQGIEPELLAQFPLLEDALEAMGVVVWPMTELEADDALASAAALTAGDDRVEQVLICTPDKDLSQCVVGRRVVQFDRRQRQLRDADGVRDKFGVPPEAIPDYLALVGDSADGFPGIPGFGAKTAAVVLERYGSLEAIPPNGWDVPVRGADKLAKTLRDRHDEAMLYRRLATLRSDAPLFDSVDELAWSGPEPTFPEVCERLEAPELTERAATLARSATT